jgi:hypothetical protein
MRRPLPTEHVENERSSSDPLEEAIRNADLAALWSAIAALPRPQRDALLLREFGGLSYAELAGALAVTGSAVESLLFRARHGVKARLEAAYAALSGASWLESLTRLFGGIGGGMAPVAAKVAVVGVGAAVATGGYVAAPHVLQRPSKPALPAQTQRAIPAPAVALVARTHSSLAAANVQHPATSGDPARLDPARHRAARRGSDDREAASTSASDGRESGSQEADHGGRVSTPERSSADETGSSRGRDGSHSGGTSGSGSSDGSGDGSGGGSGDASGDDSGRGEDHGGVVTTVPNPAVTVTVPATGPAPPVGEPVPTTGG